MDVHATLRDRLATLLVYAVPVRGWQPVSPCASGTVSACFEAPDSYEHLAPVTWFGTARLLVLCGTARSRTRSRHPAAYPPPCNWALASIPDTAAWASRWDDTLGNAKNPADVVQPAVPALRARGRDD